MHGLCVLFTLSNGEGALFHTLHSPASLNQNLCGLFYFPNMSVERCLFSVLICLSTTGASVRSFTTAPSPSPEIAPIWPRSHLGTALLLSSAKKQVLPRRGAWQPLAEVSLSHPEEPEGLNKAAL